MAKMKLSLELLEAAVLGGCVLGGGGGGAMSKGYDAAKIGLEKGEVYLIDPSDLEDDAYLINVSNVGAPSATNSYVATEDYGKAIEMISREMNIDIKGIITNEAGGSATVNGWLQSALLGIPVVDAPCNGRAHPTGTMGSMGLHRDPEYVSYQSAIGGKKEQGRHVEMVASGNLARVARLVREVAVEADGLATVARNPVTCKYAKENGACGAVKQAIELGQAMIAAKPLGVEKILEAVCEKLHGEIVLRGKIDKILLECKGGFDVGSVKIGNTELTFWNEYMTLEKEDKRIGTFPDLIMTFDMATGTPVTSAEIKEGMEVAVLFVDSEYIKLGGGMKDPELFKQCEKAVGKDIISYVF